MQYTSCTEDRIQHALDRCLDGLRSSEFLSLSWNSGRCMNRWSLDELLRRDPENLLILLQQILKRAREVLEECEYELLAPLTIMFRSTLLQTPYCPVESGLLIEAQQVFHSFLTWPEPYCTVCHHVLTTIQQELKAPGISYHRLVKEEQGLTTDSQHGRTITVFMLNPADVPSSFLSVVEQLSNASVMNRDITVNLIKHAFQSTMGSKYPLHSISQALQSLNEEELSQTLLTVSELLETAASMTDTNSSRAHVEKGLEELRQKLNIPECSRLKSEDGMLQILRLPTSKCYTIHWDTDNFDILDEFLETDPELAPLLSEEQTEVDEDEEEEPDELEEEEEEDEAEERDEMDDCLDPRASMFSTTSSLSTASKDSMLSSSSDVSPLSTLSSSSQASGTDSDFCEDVEEECNTVMPMGKNKSGAGLSKRLSRLFKPRGNSLCRTKSLGNTDIKDKKDLLPKVRSKRSNSVPQPALSLRDLILNDNGQTKQVRFRKRPILSSTEVQAGTVLIRVMVCGADYMAGKLARAYNNLRIKEKILPRLTRHCDIKFFFVPIKRDPAANGGVSPYSSPVKNAQEVSSDVFEYSTHDITHLIGMLDPWYEQNIQCLLEVPIHGLCETTSKSDSDVVDNQAEGKLPIMADLLLYYCRNASRPILIQLYQAELTLAGGETRTEVFIHSLELGHTAGTRAIMAMGAASKRFGIDGNREAVPLSLELVYNRVFISGRSQKTKVDKVCTSINVTKMCRNLEELDPKMECLQMTVTEVLKRQNSKSKRNYNQQLSTTQVKVDKVRVSGADNATFAVCLDQDEKKILQSVTRCEVSVCYKTDGSSDWLKMRTMYSQIEQACCSLLCLPISTFSGPQA